MKTIRQLREDRGWTQLALAVRAGVDPSMVYRWERGLTRPSRHNVLRLARLFGISVEDVVLGPAEQAPRGLDQHGMG